MRSTTVTLVATLSLGAAGACKKSEPPKREPQVAPLPSVPPSALGKRCPSVRPTKSAGTVRSKLINEASGLAASRKNKPILWVHNDSGDSARVFAIGRDGKQIAILNLTGAEAIDWEDMALGPGPKDNQDYLYLGDIGDNKRKRKEISVHRVAEPVVSVDGPDNFNVQNYDTLRLRYGDGGSYDSETLLIDPPTGDMYVITKDGKTGTSHVYRAPAPLSSPISLSRVTTLEFGKAPLGSNPWATAGDISLDGSLVIIKTYETAFVWRRAEGTALADTLKQHPCQVPVAIEPQGESITFSADGRGYFTLSEEEEQPLNFFELVP